MNCFLEDAEWFTSALSLAKTIFSNQLLLDFLSVTGTTPEDASVLVQPTNASVPFGDDDFPKDITNSTLVKNNITEKQVVNCALLF